MTVDELIALASQYSDVDDGCQPEHASSVLGKLARGILDLFADRLLGPIPMRMQCPACGTLHIDEGEFAAKPHHTHACQRCGEVWRPAVVATVGVRFLPGFKDTESK